MHVYQTHAAIISSVQGATYYMYGLLLIVAENSSEVQQGLVHVSYSQPCYVF